MYQQEKNNYKADLQILRKIIHLPKLMNIKITEMKKFINKHYNKENKDLQYKDKL